MEQSVDLKKVLGFQFEPTKVSYNRRDLLIYALGINATEQRFAFEDGASQWHLQRLPTLGDTDLPRDSSFVALFCR